MTGIIKLERVDQLPASGGYPYVLVSKDERGTLWGQIPAGDWTPKDDQGKPRLFPLEEAVRIARGFASVGLFETVLLVAPGILLPDHYGANASL